MAELYLVNLSQKTSRGMRANAEQGLATGSRLYGYRSQPGGALEIVPTEAATIVRIFERYAAGDTGRDIAAALNVEGVPSVGRGVECQFDHRRPQPWQRRAKHRALRWRQGVEPDDRDQGSGHWQTPAYTETSGPVAPHAGSGPAHCACRSLGPGTRP